VSNDQNETATRDLLQRDAGLRKRLFERQLTGMLIALLCLVPLAQTRIIEFGFRSSNKVQIAFFFVFVAVFLCRDYFRLEVLGAVVTTTLVAFILSAVRHLGVLAPIHIGVPFVAVFVSMLFGRRAALWCFGLTCVAIAATGILHLTGDLNYLLEPRQYAHSWTSWLILVCTEVAFVSASARKRASLSSPV